MTEGTAGDPGLLAAWDARGEHTAAGCTWMGWEHRAAAEQWARGRGIIGDERGHPRSATYRLEFWLVDLPFAVAWRYAKNDSERLRWEPGTAGPARSPPERILLADLPPPEFLGVFF